MKLDRLIAKHRQMGRTAALRAIAGRKVQVNDLVVADGHAEVDRFCTVMLDEEAVQVAERGLYLLMHKPVGWLSATKDAQHPTTIPISTRCISRADWTETPPAC
jgi:16S rRNA pseudouridine516 synthase